MDIGTWYVVVVVLLMLLTFLFVWSAREVAAFKEKFPPISDAEFLIRCSPNVRPEVALKVRQLVAEHSGVEYERIYPETEFVDLFA